MGARRAAAREAAGLLRTLHAWPVPAELATLLRRPATMTDPLRRAGAELVPPPAVALALIPLVRQLPFVDHGVLDAAAGLLRTFPDQTAGNTLLHGDFYLVNVLVRDGRVSALIDFEFARTGPPELELLSVARVLDVTAGPPLLDWLAADYPELCTDGLDTRLWRYAIAYTVRHILFWPPDRAESAGLDPGHPVHTLRRLVDGQGLSIRSCHTSR
jgi:aminoglycoside phosphotransferase (APT) family kinase protein